MLEATAPELPNDTIVTVPAVADAGSGSAAAALAAVDSDTASRATFTHATKHILLGNSLFLARRWADALKEFTTQMNMENDLIARDGRLDTAFQYALRLERHRRTKQQRRRQAGLPVTDFGTDVSAAIERALASHEEEKRKRRTRVRWLLLRVADCFHMMARHGRASVLYHQLLAATQTDGAVVEEPLVMLRLAMAYRSDGQLQQAARWAALASSTYGRLKDSMRQVRALHVLETLYTQQLNTDGAERCAKQRQFIESSASQGDSSTLGTRVTEGQATLAQWEAQLRGAVADAIKPDIVCVRGWLSSPMLVPVPLLGDAFCLFSLTHCAPPRPTASNACR